MLTGPEKEQLPLFWSSYLLSILEMTHKYPGLKMMLPLLVHPDVMAHSIAGNSN